MCTFSKHNNGLKGLKKAHTQFELKPLKDDFIDTDIPHLAVDASARAMKSLLTLCSNMEIKHSIGNYLFPL